MYYLNYYIVFVIVAMALWAISVFFVFPVIYHLVKKHEIPSWTEEKIENYSVVAILAIVCTPFIYEFRPIFKCVGDQYEIVRASDGKVDGLKKDAVGFHWPLCAGDKFVCLDPQNEFKKTIVFPGDGQIIEIPYRVICNNPAKAYVALNGEIHLLDAKAIDGFRKIIKQDWLAEQPEKLPSKPADVYEFVLKKAEMWSSTNPYSCQIIVESADRVKGLDQFWIK